MKITELSSISILNHYGHSALDIFEYLPLILRRVDVVLYSKNYTRHYYDDVTQSSLDRLACVLKANFRPKDGSITNDSQDNY